VQGGTAVRSRSGFFLGEHHPWLEKVVLPSRFNQTPKPALDALWQDQIGDYGKPIDLRLAPLGDYGGPVPTMPPLPGSPLIDAVDPKRDPLSSDARGVQRPIGKRHDIGAVEVDPARDQ